MPIPSGAYPEVGQTEQTRTRAKSIGSLFRRVEEARPLCAVQQRRPTRRVNQKHLNCSLSFVTSFPSCCSSSKSFPGVGVGWWRWFRRSWAGDRNQRQLQSGRGSHLVWSDGSDVKCKKIHISKLLCSILVINTYRKYGMIWERSSVHVHLKKLFEGPSAGLG